MPKRGYHHGNLREALVDGCLRLIQKRGPTGFSLSEAAREAGVTPAAIYRHFEGREALIAAAAEQGYGIFGDMMRTAFAGGRPSALAAFAATSRAYLDFARSYPGHYIAMFESGLVTTDSPALHAAAKSAMKVFEQASADLSQHIPADKRPPPQMVSAHILALSHGVVELYARRDAGANSPFSPEDLLESGIGIYLRGLGLIAADG